MKTIKNLLIAAILVAIYSCANDETPNKTTLLTQKTWTFSSLSGYDDFTNSFVSALLTGSTYKFNTNGTVTITALGVSDTGNWQFNSEETIIILEPGTADAENWTIVTLNESTLKISGEDADALNGTYTMTFK